MKSKIKRDFIDENQEVIEIQRKIRVKISDPDATESSSDDEKQEKSPKLIVHEIVQEKEKLKKAKNANVEKVISAKFELGSSSSSNPPLMVDSQNTDSSNESDDRLKKAKNAKEKKVISAKSELCASSSDPLLMVDEINEQLKKSKNAKDKMVISAKSAIGSSSSDPILMVDEIDEQLQKAINANAKKVISAKSELGCSSSDQVDAQTSDSSNGVEEKDQESDEEMWMGQWIQISGDKEVKFSHKLGVPVVDNYGFLLGEFSKLDDLSISV